MQSVQLLEEALIQFFELPADQLNFVKSTFTLRNLHKGNYLFSQGGRVDQLVFQSSGLIRVSALVENDNTTKDVTQWISQPGYFITDVAGLFSNLPCRWNVQTLTETTIWTVGKDGLQLLSEKVPNWELLERNFLIKCFAMVENRMFQHLYQSAEERYIALMAYAPNLFNEVPLQFLASMLGMTQETLSRLRGKKR